MYQPTVMFPFANQRNYNNGICATVFSMKSYAPVKLTSSLWKSELRPGRTASRQKSVVYAPNGTLQRTSFENGGFAFRPTMGVIPPSTLYVN